MANTREFNFCGKCGAQNSSNNKFCSKCGMRIHGQEKKVEPSKNTITCPNCGNINIHNS